MRIRIAEWAIGLGDDGTPVAQVIGAERRAFVAALTLMASAKDMNFAIDIDRGPMKHLRKGCVITGDEIDAVASMGFQFCPVCGRKIALSDLAYIEELSS